ncbi:xyloside transporter [Klebsiella pneumoniae]|uniref:Xyloside transporter n=1 Tax=Klebsiella pneumoniae TaxID=573 RepID=A0A2X3FK27_KLEPN|nr:xyloside transporter [Klebsiella pneumoniae]
MHDALWLAYIATFIKQWGLTSATGFMWALGTRKLSRTAN